ncbi:MAG TPA: hypothetical protein VNH84_09470 [Candidatus Saccharimonadales bacterium]|nr:hypothetical protein [Candidatus Saccharimonadales bacterium]
MTNLIAFLHTTAAYQAAALQLMVGEANFAAHRLGLPEEVPAVTNLLAVAEVGVPPLGVGGAVGTSNYLFSFAKGRLRSIRKREWLSKVQPPASNLFNLTRTPSLLDTNSAHQLATQWLAALTVDVIALERKHTRHIFQAPTRVPNADPREPEATVLTPLFQISWGVRPPPADFWSPVRVKLLGSTKQLLELDINDTTLLRRPRLMVTNKAALLGPLPPPRHFVEQLFGGREAYETVASPEQVEAFLLNSRIREEESKLPEIRQGPTRVDLDKARRLSDALLDFDTYQWSAVKLCSPDYGIKVRFVRGPSVVEALLCFECGIVAVTAKGAIRHENFDFNHNALVKVVQEIFPRDEEITRLELNEGEQAKRQEFLQGLAREIDSGAD